MDKKIFVGKQNSPLAVIKRREISYYITDDLKEHYEVWSRFNSGFGLPYSANWGDYPDRFISILSLMVNLWEEAKK